VTGRVLLVVGHATGGIGEHVSSLALGLPGLGWQPQVLTSPLTASRFDLGPDVLPLWPLRSAAAWLAARRAVSAATVVHAHGHQAGSVALAVAATIRSAPPIVISWHNAVLGDGLRRRSLAVLERRQAHRAVLVTGASSDLVARAAALGAVRAELAPVASSIQGGRLLGRAERIAARVAVRQQLELPAEATLLLTVSRIAPQKDLDVLVEAALRLRRLDLRPAPVWLVAGDGDPGLASALAARAVLGRADVRFLGHRRDIDRLLAAADVFALASRWEARSLAVQEAMAAGLPIVVSRVGGLPDLVADAGLIVPAGSAQALADAVAGLIGDPALAADLGRRARMRFAELPTPDQVLAGWAARYDSLAVRLPDRPGHC
jgi:glycosyltransferase involved in cell wall biosynthesis